MIVNIAPRASSERRAWRFTGRSSHDGRPGDSPVDGNQRPAPVVGLIGEGPVRLAPLPTPVAARELDITIGWIIRSPDVVGDYGLPLDAPHLDNAGPPPRVIPGARSLITGMGGPHNPRGRTAPSHGAFGIHMPRSIGPGNWAGSPPDRWRACPW